MNKNFILIAASIVVLVGAGFLLRPTFAGANVTDHGITSVVASSSLMSVGPSNAVTLFAKTTACASRIVSTLANPVMLSFASGLTPNATTGHVQAASTTVAYDNLTYGCGQLSAYGFNASTSITVTQLNQ